jgi:aminomethyltransferase
MVDFAGWDMPLHYGSQLEEHRQVRTAAGMFDVSHMAIIDVEGARAGDFLRYLLANDVGRLAAPGAALYTCMLNPEGGVKDDLIVYLAYAGRFRTVVNAGTRAKDLDWMRQQADAYDVMVRERSDLAMIAVQGPQARGRVLDVLAAGNREVVTRLRPFHGLAVDELFIARTGYTGEDGFEVMVPAGSAPALWRALLAQEVQPCGLGARDTLRLEAGLPLYGNDMDETTSPLVSGLAWTVAWEPETRDFIGRGALQAERRSGPQQRRVGLVLEDKGVLRQHQPVLVEGVGQGEVTSGGFSPTLNRSIALARVPAGTTTDSVCRVEVRGRFLAVRVVRPPFVGRGKPAI